MTVRFNARHGDSRAPVWVVDMVETLATTLGEDIEVHVREHRYGAAEYTCLVPVRTHEGEFAGYRVRARFHELASGLVV